MPRHAVVMLTTSYPRFPGDGVGSFIEPIAKGVAARGHDVHLVAPWHPAIRRGPAEDGVSFHFYKYALTRAMNVFGYAEGLRADTHVRTAAWAAAPAALLAGVMAARRVVHETRATVVHAHWVIPGGAMGMMAARGLPLVISLHGSDVYVAERHGLMRSVARRAFRRANWVTACSDDLRTRAIALGAEPSSTETVPYGVDVDRFTPGREPRAVVRARFGVETDVPFVFSAGRLVSKKGFEFLIDAVAALSRTRPRVCVAIAGDGDLREALQARAAASGARVLLLGNQSQDLVAALAAAADVIVVPSVHDEAGNVDGLPNFALEALASATPVVATRVGGLPQAIEDGATGWLVPERNVPALAAAIDQVLAQPDRGRALGAAARTRVTRDFGWGRVAASIEAAYARAGARPR